MVVDFVADVEKMIFDGWSTGTGGVKPTIDKEQDFRYIPINTEYVLVNSLAQGDNFLGIGAVDYLRDVGVSVMVHTSQGRTRMIQMLEECRRIIRTKSKWTVNGNKYDMVQMSVDTDLSDRKRKDWSISFDVTAILIESV